MERDMAATILLDDQLEQSVERLVQSGAFASRAAVVARGVALIHEQQIRVRDFDAAILEGWEQSQAGDVVDADAGFDAIEAKWKARLGGRAA
jgi:putative addiction module CopG family antidote